MVLLKCFIASVALALGGLSTGSQTRQNVTRFEQSDFSADRENAEPLMRRPVGLPDAALHALQNDKRVGMCSNDGHPPREIHADWFVASEIHLDGSDETDLIVQPRYLHENAGENRCLFGANIASFWVLRNTPQGYSVALQVDVLELKVLESRRDGYRDITASAVFAGYVHSTRYRFDGQNYAFDETQAKLIGQPINSVGIPEGAVRVLAGDDAVTACLAMGNMPTDQLPASWFVTSEVHLASDAERDLLIQPRNVVGAPTAAGPVTCFVRPYSTHFWIVRETPQGFELVFSASGHGAKVSESRTKGLSDVVLTKMTPDGKAAGEVNYKFDGQKYQPQRKVGQLNKSQ